MSYEWKAETPFLEMTVCSSGCNLAWKSYRRELLRAFKQANPQLARLKFLYRPGPCTAKLVAYGRCGRNCIGCKPCGDWLPDTSWRDVIFDHSELTRTGNDARLLFTHPYGDAQSVETAVWAFNAARLTQGKGARLIHLAAKVLGDMRSWYYPRSSNMVVIGDVEMVRSIDADYEVPTKKMPHHCRRWH